MGLIPRVGLVVALVAAAAPPAAAQHFCDDPPVLTQLTGEPVSVSGLESQGHPVAFSWYVTPPGAPIPSEPTSESPVYAFTPDAPGLWSVALVADYQHQAVGGGLWSSETCLTIEAARVVAVIGLAAVQVPTDEELEGNGFASRWAAGVVPVVEWQVDGLPLGACNGGPPPATPGDLSCTIPANWLAPGLHTAGLRLTDPSSGQSHLSTAVFEVIEVIPLSVDFGWTPIEPDPGQLVHFVAAVNPTIPEQDFTEVTWDLGDGTIVVHNSCPLFFGSCLEWPHTYATDGWYDVSITVETADETAFRTYAVKIGDPVNPPTASFTVLPTEPMILEDTSLAFDGSCDDQCTWTWDFGDGAGSSAENPVHAWAVPATYTVTLTVSNPGGTDSTSRPIDVRSCWQPAAPTQSGACYGGQVTLTAAAGNGWSWNTGATVQSIAAPLGGAYWVNVDDGNGCWGHAAIAVALSNCGDIDGDTNLDGATDAADLAALVPELTDGDGDSVTTAGGGDLTAPGGDVTGDFHLRADDQLTVLIKLFE